MKALIVIDGYCPYFYVLGQAWVEIWRKLFPECTSQGTGLNSNTDLAATF
jgi:hypothetical protein